MRIDRLDLIAFGAFESISLDFSEGKEGLHLIYGDNEAGKSTTLRALRALLFGIPSRTSDNFRHKNAQLRIGAKLRFSNGDTVEFIRRKGNKQTLLNYSGDKLDDDMLAKYLPVGLDERLFSSLWGIDYIQLIEGGKELLNDQGDLGQSLFGAALGTSNIKEVLASFDDQAEQVYKKRGTTTPLNRSIQGYKESTRRIKDLRLSLSDWQKLDSEFQEKRVGLKKLEDEIEENVKLAKRFERLKRVKSIWGEKLNIAQSLAAVEEVAILSDDIVHKREKILSAREYAKLQKDKAATRFERAEKELELLVPNKEFIDQEKEIVALHKKLGVVDESVVAIPKLESQRELLLSKINTLDDFFKESFSYEKIEELKHVTLRKKMFFSLKEERNLIEQKTQDLTQALEKIQNEIEELKTKASEFNNVFADTNELKVLIRSIRKLGDIDGRIDELCQKDAVESKSSHAMLKQMGRFSGDIDEVAQVSLPLVETLSRYEEEEERLLESQKELNKREAELKNSYDDLNVELRALVAKKEVPSVDILDEMRHSRDEYWARIKNGLLTIENQSINHSSKSKKEETLIIQYEKSIDDADAYADKLRLAADDVVKQIDLELSIEQSRKSLDELKERRKEISLRVDDFDRRWKNEWQDPRISPLSPREMKEWISKFSALISRIETLNDIRIEKDKLNDERRRYRNMLGEVFVNSGGEFSQNNLTLGHCVEECERFLEEQEDNHREKIRLDELTKEKKRNLSKVVEELELLEKKNTTWKEKWGDLAGKLGEDAISYPEVAIDRVEKIEERFELQSSFDIVEKEILQTRTFIKEYQNALAKIIGDDALQIDRGMISARVAQLYRDLTKEKETLAKYQQAVKERESASADQKSAIDALEKAIVEIKAIMTDANVGDELALAKAIDVSEDKKKLLERQNAILEELGRNSDGLDLDALEKEIAENDLDLVENELERVKYKLEKMQQERDDLRDERKVLETKRERYDGRSEAANAAEDAQEHLASAASQVEEYLRAKIAGLLLRKYIEEYRKENQTPLLKSGGAFFEKLTAGSFVGLRDEIDSNERAILLGVRANNEEVRVEGMSEGTRSQLYLALRLAAIEDHLKQSEAIPFVVDDIFMSFDDQRTMIGLELLKELAQKTQVLVFTHHRRMLQLVEDMKTKTDLFVHELGS